MKKTSYLWIARLIMLTPSIALADSAYIEPSWWRHGELPIINEEASPSLNVAVNVGQAKWVTKSALNEIARYRPDIAALIQADLIGNNKPLQSLDPPQTASQEWLDIQKAPITVGQLKAITAPFYKNFHSKTPVWLLTQRILNENIPDNASLDEGGNYPFPYSEYPWTTTKIDDSNYSIATVAQLKILFSLRFSSMPSLSDNEITDTDGDGISDEDETLAGTSSTDADTDSDGIIDKMDADPLVPDFISQGPPETILIWRPIE